MRASFRFFFCALATYSTLLLVQFHIKYFIYGVALINAFVIDKVYSHRRSHTRWQGVATDLGIYKLPFLFSLLVFAFHIVEEMIKRLMHGKVSLVRSTRFVSMTCFPSSIIVFCTFIPLFAFRELGRVLGQDKF